MEIILRSKHLVPFLLAMALLMIAPAMNPQQLFAQLTTSASCGRCGKNVPSSSKAGDRCPHCGVTWGKESRYRESRSSLPRNSSAAELVLPTTSDVWFATKATIAMFVVFGVVAAGLAYRRVRLTNLEAVLLLMFAAIIVTACYMLWLHFTDPI